MMFLYLLSPLSSSLPHLYTHLPLTEKTVILKDHGVEPGGTLRNLGLQVVGRQLWNLQHLTRRHSLFI